MEAVINECSVINSDHALAVDEETELKKYSVNPWEPVEANSPYAYVIFVKTNTTITTYPCLHLQHNGSSPTIVPCGWGDTTQSLLSHLLDESLPVTVISHCLTFLDAIKAMFTLSSRLNVLLPRLL